MEQTNNVRKLVVATQNAGKIREIQAILKGLPCMMFPVGEVDPDFFVEEDGQTYAANAIKKAAAASRLAGCLAIADDSGLEVDALNGAPGVYSARFGGEALPFAEKIALLLRQLHGVPHRTARFRCVMALVTPAGQVETTEGVCEGLIGKEARGDGGFGFDPIFIVPEYGKTLAELDPIVKNMMSHRARALSHLRNLLQKHL